MIGARGHSDICVVCDQTFRATDLGHDFIARIDAERAVNALKLRAIADIDPNWANLDALIAIDAVAAVIPALGFSLRTARFAAIKAIGHIEGVLIRERALNARPWAHVGTDLFAHPAGKKVSGQRQNGSKPIGR